MKVSKDSKAFISRVITLIKAIDAVRAGLFTYLNRLHLSFDCCKTGLLTINGEGYIPYSTKLAAGLRSVARNNKATRLLTRPG